MEAMGIEISTQIDPKLTSDKKSRFFSFHFSNVPLNTTSLTPNPPHTLLLTPHDKTTSHANMLKVSTYPPSYSLTERHP
jgi:hypothetical protein